MSFADKFVDVKHTGYVAIENVYTFDERSEIVRTEFSIAVCRPTGDKWPLKTLFLAISIQVQRLLRAFSIATNPVCK